MLLKKKRLAEARPKDIPKAPRSLEDAVKIAAWITHAVLIGTIDARTAEAAVKGCRQFQLAEEKRKLQKQVEQLQAELASARANQKRTT